MAESAKIEAPNVMSEKFSTPRRRWKDWVITAPGYRVVMSQSTTMAAAGGFAGGFLLTVALGATAAISSGAVAAVVMIGGPFFGVGYAKFVNRLVGTDGLIKRGKAVRLLDGPLSQLVVKAAKRNAAGYFRAAQRAAELDAVARKLSDRALTSAERAVLERDLDEGTKELNLILCRASMNHAAALLNPSDPAIRAAGFMTAAMYEELQEGKSASYDETL